MRRAPSLGLLLLLALSTPACGSDGSGDGECATEGTGTLALDITGLPAAFPGAPKITITGKDGSHHDVAAAGPVTLPSGLYTVSARTVVDTDPIVRSVYVSTTAAASVCVKPGPAASATLGYSLLRTSNKLWATNADGDHSLLGFASTSLAASGAPPASVARDIEIPGGIAFDREGGLWAVIGAAGGRTIAHYPATSFVGGGTLTPDRTITGPELNEGSPSATEIALDRKGDVWVAIVAANKVLRYEAAGASQAPMVTISNVKAPKSLAFDKDGDLWVSESGEDRIVEYAAARLGASTGDPANIALSAQTPTLPTAALLQSPLGLAFDAANNLWANFNGAMFVRFTPAERAATATITPAVQIHLPAEALAEGIAFDDSGALWFAYTQGKIARLDATHLATNGDVTPDVIVSSPSVVYGANVAFFPPAQDLPLDALLAQ